MLHHSSWSPQKPWGSPFLSRTPVISTTLLHSRQSQHPHNPCRPSALIFYRFNLRVPFHLYSWTSSLRDLRTDTHCPGSPPALPSDLDAPCLLHCPVGITSQHHACSTPWASPILLPCPVLLRPRSPLTPAVAPFFLPLLLISLHPSRPSVLSVPINSSARHSAAA